MNIKIKEVKCSIQMFKLVNTAIIRQNVEKETINLRPWFTFCKTIVTKPMYTSGF
jgi:hypothetical protein